MGDDMSPHVKSAKRKYSHLPQNLVSPSEKTNTPPNMGQTPGPITLFEQKKPFTISELERQMESMVVTLQQIQDGESPASKNEVFEKILSLFENSELYKIDPDH
jgi:hypothetical protein